MRGTKKACDVAGFFWLERLEDYSLLAFLSNFPYF